MLFVQPAPPTSVALSPSTPFATFGTSSLDTVACSTREESYSTRTSPSKSAVVCAAPVPTTATASALAPSCRISSPSCAGSCSRRAGTVIS